MACDMCGNSKEPFFLASIEGVTMQVCSNCKSHGTIVKSLAKSPIISSKLTQKPTNITAIQSIISNYSIILKDAREKLGLKQKEVGQKLGIKESIIHKLESGNFEPNINMAQKLEKFYHIKLIETTKESKFASSSTDSGEITLGDLVKIKKR